jgi:hypothetical protein
VADLLKFHLSSSGSSHETEEPRDNGGQAALDPSSCVSALDTDIGVLVRNVEKFAETAVTPTDDERNQIITGLSSRHTLPRLLPHQKCVTHLDKSCLGHCCRNITHTFVKLAIRNV